MTELIDIYIWAIVAIGIICGAGLIFGYIQYKKAMKNHWDFCRLRVNVMRSLSRYTPPERGEE